jgi:hypothetical protein
LRIGAPQRFDAHIADLSRTRESLDALVAVNRRM